MVTIYDKNSSNYPTTVLSYTTDETDTTIASFPYSNSSGYFILSMRKDNSSSFTYDFAISNSTIVYSSSSSNQTIGSINKSFSNNNVTISTHIRSDMINTSVSLKSSGSNYGEGVIVGKYNNQLYFTVPNEEQLVISPSNALTSGNYLNDFNIVDNNSVNWKFTSQSVSRNYDTLYIGNFQNIVYSNGTAGASNVDTNFFMSNFGNFTTNCNGTTLNSFKRGANPPFTYSPTVIVLPFEF